MWRRYLGLALYFAHLGVGFFNVIEGVGLAILVPATLAQAHCSRVASSPSSVCV